MRRRILKQQLDKAKHATDAWINGIKNKTGRRPKFVIDKEMLNYLIVIVASSTDVVKIFNSHRIIVSWRIKENQLEIILQQKEDNNDIIMELKGVHDFFKSIEELRARKVLRSKVIKV